MHMLWRYFIDDIGNPAAFGNTEWYASSILILLVYISPFPAGAQGYVLLRVRQTCPGLTLLFI